MTTVRLVCRLADDTERKVIVNAADFHALTSTAANKLGCTEDAVIVEIKDDQDFWEIDETYWAAIQHNETLFVRSRTTPNRASTGERDVAGSSSQPSTAAEPADASNAPKKRAKSASSGATTERATKRKKVARRSSGGGNASASDVGESSAYSASETSTAAADAAATQPRKKKKDKGAKKTKKNDEGKQPQYIAPSSGRVAVAAANPASSRAWNLNRLAPASVGSRRSWSSKEDTILWEKLRLEIARRRSQHIPIVTQREVFDCIAADHGTNGTKTQALKGRTADGLLSRARHRVQEAVASRCPVPPDLLSLFKFRTIVQPTTSSKRRSHQQDIIHQQRAEGNRRFGMASIGTTTGSSTASSSRSSTATQQDPRPSAAILPHAGIGTDSAAPTRNTVVVRDSSDEDEDQGNESEWQSDVPQPEDSDSESDRSDEEHPMSESSQRVQRMWGGRQISSVEFCNRGANHWPAPPTLLPSAASANNPPGSASSSTFSAAESARETQRRQAALNPFAPRGIGAAEDSSSRSTPIQVDTHATPPQAGSSSSTVAVSTATPDGARPTGPQGTITSSSSSIPHTQTKAPVTSSSSTSDSERPLAQMVSPSTSTIKSEPNDIDLQVPVDQHSPSSAIIDTTTTPSPRATVKAQLPEDIDLAGHAQDVSEDELRDDDEESGLEGSAESPSTNAAASSLRPRIQKSPTGSWEDLYEVEIAMSEPWSHLRHRTAEIVQRHVKPRSRVSGGLDLGDIDYAAAAPELLDLLTDLHRGHSGTQGPMPHMNKAYQAVALTIAFEVFGSVAPTQWSVRRTSFAVAGYFAAIRQRHNDDRQRGKCYLPPGDASLGLERFMRVSQKIFWCIGSAADGSGYLERESDDLSAALAFNLDRANQVPFRLSKGLDLTESTLSAGNANARTLQNFITLARRALDLLDKIEASSKFLARCEIPTQQWGASKQLEGRGQPWSRLDEVLGTNTNSLQKALAQPSTPEHGATLQTVMDANMALRARLQNLRNAGIISARRAPPREGQDAGVHARKSSTAGSPRGGHPPKRGRSGNQRPPTTSRSAVPSQPAPKIKIEADANGQGLGSGAATGTQPSASLPTPPTSRAMQDPPAFPRGNLPPRPPSRPADPVNETSRNSTRPLFQGAGSPVIGESSVPPEMRPLQSAASAHQRWG